MDKGSPHSFSTVPPPDHGLAALHKDQLQASAVIAALQRAALDGDVSFSLSAARVTFSWPNTPEDALFVFEAITGRKP